MVAISNCQYDEMVDLIGQIQEDQLEYGLGEALAQQVDRLITEMNCPGASEATAALLFGEPASLNEACEHGATEAGQ